MEHGRSIHRSAAELESALDHLRGAPAADGVLELIVRRPALDEREVLDVGHLSFGEGLVGDTWNQRGSRRTADGGPHPDMQLNLMNVRMARLLAGGDDRIPLAGDQLYVDLDLSDEHLPHWTELVIGPERPAPAVIQVTDQPHNGCAKFAERFGQEAVRFVNSAEGKRLHLRGINARVVTEGEIRAGDRVVVRPT